VGKKTAITVFFFTIFFGSWFVSLNKAQAQSLPDLQSENINGLMNPPINTSTQFSTRVWNLGNTQASSFVNRWYIDSNIQQSHTINSLSPGTASSRFYLDYTFTAAGSHEVKFCADAANQVDEGPANEDNNCETLSINVASSPEPTPQSPPPTPQPPRPTPTPTPTPLPPPVPDTPQLDIVGLEAHKRGENGVELCWNDISPGNGFPEETNWFIYDWVVKPDGTGQWYKFPSANGLSFLKIPGTPGTGPRCYNDIEGLPTGTHQFFILAVDNTGAGLYYDFAVEFTINAPDLIITELTLNKTEFEPNEQGAQVNFTVKNQGNAPASNFVVGVYRNFPTFQPDCTKIKDVTISFSGLSADGSDSGHAEFQVESGPGPKSLKLLVDAGTPEICNQVAESNEDNNVKELGYTVVTTVKFDYTTDDVKNYIKQEVDNSIISAPTYVHSSGQVNFGAFLWGLWGCETGGTWSLNSYNSSSGATGSFQYLPSTWAELSDSRHYNVNWDIWDPYRQVDMTIMVIRDGGYSHWRYSGYGDIPGCSTEYQWPGYANSW